MDRPGPRRVALFGGTFDPPHVGHLVVANEVRFRGGFDSVLLVVAHDPWQKRGTREVTASAIRLEMVAAAVDGCGGLSASDIELRRGGATYTIDTVEELLAAEPDLSISLVLGADAVAGLQTWHRVDELAALVDLTVVRRGGYGEPVPPEGWRTTVVEVPEMDVSSTDIRRRCADSEPIDFWITEPVRSVVVSRGLYGVRR